MHDLTHIPTRNLFLPRSYYWVDFTNYYNIVGYYLKSNDDIYKSIIRILNFSFAFLLNIFGFNYVDNTSLTQNETNVLNLELMNDGYISLEDQAMLGSRDSDFEISDNSQPQLRKLNAINAYESSFSDLQPNMFLINFLLDLIALSDNHSIKLFLVVHPKMANYKEIISSLSYIDSDHILDLGNPLEHPDLWLESHSFDIGHLNEFGARVFTQYLFRDFANSESNVFCPTISN